MKVRDMLLVARGCGEEGEFVVPAGGWRRDFREPREMKVSLSKSGSTESRIPG